MFKSKSFHLVSEDDKHQLYQAKKFRCLNYIVFPALTGFVMLLILVNVDFTGTAYDTEQMREIAVNHDARSARASNCYDRTNCLLVCDYGQVGSVLNDLETMKKNCPGDLTLVLDGCSLRSGRLDKSFLTGSYRLENFTINDCGLESIDNGAFQVPTVERLKVLLLRKSLFITLSASTFLGLPGLQQLVLENVQRLTPLKADQFLEPIAASIVDVVVRHESNSVYDPTPWLGGKVKFSQLRTLDMHGNRFGDHLKSLTFALMTNLQLLDLSSCELTHIANGTFDAIAKTLTHLYLNNNKLVRIDWHFLAVQQLEGSKNLQLAAEDNLWDCTCDNRELVEFVKENSNTMTKVPMCETPQNYYQVNMVFVFLECEDDSTTTAITTIGDDSSSTTTTTSIGDDSSSTTDVDISGDTTTTTTIADDSSSTTTTTTIGDDNSSPNEGDVSTETDPTTTPIYDIPTTNVPDFIQFECEHENYFSTITLRKGDVDFMIVTDSTTSVRLVTRNDLTQLLLVYFNETRQFNRTSLRNDDKGDAATTLLGNYRQRKSTKINEILVDGLENKHTYTFCLVPRLQTSTSPFNCRSHFVYVPNDSGRKWLADDDVAWVVSLIVLGLVLCLLAGLLITYCLLRMRPTWLRGCPGVQPISDKSKKVVLFPSKSRISLEEQYVFSELIKKHGSISDVHCSGHSLEPNSNDYMQFYRNLELSKIKRDATFSVDNRPPEESAPRLPVPSDSRPISSQSLVRREATIYENDEENYYESVGYYQEVI